MTKRKKKAFVAEWKKLTWIRQPANYGDVQVAIYKDYQITITQWHASGRVTYEAVPNDKIMGSASSIKDAMAEAFCAVDTLNGRG